MVYRDRTYCASPQCKNECERKLSEADRRNAIFLNEPISFAYFCGEPQQGEEHD
jgi:hypothetical protein